MKTIVVKEDLAQQLVQPSTHHAAAEAAEAVLGGSGACSRPLLTASRHLGWYS